MWNIGLLILRYPISIYYSHKLVHSDAAGQRRCLGHCRRVKKPPGSSSHCIYSQMVHSSQHDAGEVHPGRAQLAIAHGGAFSRRTHPLIPPAPDLLHFPTSERVNANFLLTGVSRRRHSPCCEGHLGNFHTRGNLWRLDISPAVHVCLTTFLMKNIVFYLDKFMELFFPSKPLTERLMKV